jgi:hypothetical protein
MKRLERAEQIAMDWSEMAAKLLDKLNEEEIYPGNDLMAEWEEKAIRAKQYDKDYNNIT